ncbi:NmrA family NAD(P)-binding protein [Candidatus Berkiella aquae]|uniref:Quinone oxidoreductase 2 n=1 Tax=Candidatus Berkiella aquae TaxID=295108 RepID=A0A0Q9YWP3_9GAMM|nr:SDR family oxidoreductase [Candidatus Berkiella aquae]MCS5710948.1 SDR family oxidoreductase [Candidatus Berkiella aquae]
MLLITGGNGRLGRQLIEQLNQLHLQKQFIVSVRDMNKAQTLIAANNQVRCIDFNDTHSLEKGLKDIQTLFFISVDGPLPARMQQQQNVIEAATRMGVKHIVYTSFIDIAEDSPFALSKAHAKTEYLLKQSGITYTLLRNNLYADLVPLLAKLTDGNFTLPAHNGKVAFISREDIASFAVKVLLEPNKHQNKTYELTGSQAYTYFEVATLLSKKFSKEVNYRPGTSADYIQQLQKIGLPVSLASAMSGMYEAVKEEHLGYARISPDFEKVMGKPAKSLQDWLMI